MNKVVVNTFTEAMNKDTDKSLLSEKSYLDAQNFRMITTDGNTTGSLETIKGNKRITTSNLTSGQIIIGACEIRDKIIIFTTDNTSTTPTAGRSMIYSVVVNLENETQSSVTVLYDDSLNVDGSHLCFSSAYPIKAVGKYETPNVQKVYWTDGYNNTRFANIAAYLTVDAEVYVSSGDYMAVDKFEFLPKFIVSKPVLKDIVGGKVNTGMIAYSFQLYVSQGAETAFSPLSDPIHVVSDNDFLYNTKEYKGDMEQTNSSKGFVIQVDNSDNIGYNRLRLVRIEYSTLNATPKIIICNEVEIDPLGGTVTMTDLGDTLGELTVSEFNIDSTELFKCQDIAIKDNRLFVTNIEKSEFIVDTWDARAVRFKSASTARVFTNEDTYVDVLANLSNWSSYTEGHDGINKFNDSNHDGDSAYAWMYQADGTTVGAEGPQLKIDFETEGILIDMSQVDSSFGVPAPSSNTDKSYRDYASPWKDGKLSWQRDEVYRLFIVFGNDRGQTAEPQWICDLRMPSLHDANFSNGDQITVKPSELAEVSGGLVASNRLYPRIYFKSFPANAAYAQIYRVKRDRVDRSVVTQALVLPTHYDGSTYYYQDPAVIDITNRVFKLVSPEINVNRNIAKQSTDYLDYITDYDGNHVDTVDRTQMSVSIGNVFKLTTSTRIPYAAANKLIINETMQVSPSLTADQDAYLLDGISFKNYMDLSGYNEAKGCTGLLVAANSTSYTAWAGKVKHFVMVNYKADVFGSQYGGNTHEDRQTNVSIPCSDVVYPENTGLYLDINYGDTFINYFDATTLLADLTKHYHETWTESVYFPAESSINCSLINSKSSRHCATAADVPLGMLRQEYAGKHQDGDVNYYVQQEDMYRYNAVYSQPMDVNFAVPFNVDKILETEFDSMIKVSNVKQNGETTDSWTKFGVNDFIEVDSMFGPVNALKNFNDKLIYFQDRAFGLASVNERSVITDANASTLVLGTGGILDRYDYISSICGTQDKFSLVSSMSSLYWYDRLTKSIYKYSANGLVNLTKTKHLQSFMTTSLDSGFTAIAHADIYNDEILFTFFHENETNGFTISFNEPIDAFVSFYGFVPTIYIPHKQRYLTTTSDHYCGSDFDRNVLFLHDSDTWDRCYFYALTSSEADKYVDSTLEVLFNPDYMYTKVFDNLFYTSNTQSKTTASSPVKAGKIDVYADTFSTVQCYNDFQNTGEVSLVHKTNIERRERGWTLVVPRSIVNANISSDPNIFTAVDSTQLFKERMRDKYLIAYFKYENDGTYDKFVVSNMGLKYRVSIR